MGQGSAALATLGCAGPELPGHGCCRELRQAASWAAVGRMRGGERCRSTILVAASRGWHVMQQVAEAWWLDFVNSSPRTVTARGRAMLPTSGAALQHQMSHASLPPPLIPLPAASERVPLAPSDFLTFFVRFDSQTSRRLPHIVWKLLRRRVR